MDLHRNYIDGDWVAGSDAAPDVNPSDLSDVVGEYARADKAQAEAAIAAARAAFPKWSGSTIQERSDLLDRVGTAILARKADLGRLL
jgi:aldehyde dehydrogenase (NAD+)